MTNLDQSQVTQSTKPIRLWPVVVALAIFWAFMWSVHSIELAMFTRFISRWIVLAILLLAYLTWWLTRRQIKLADRWLAVAVMIGGIFPTAQFTDRSINAFVVFMVGFPWVFTAWTAWLWISRDRSRNFLRIGVLLTTALILGSMTLFRWEGLDGAQRMVLKWRWEHSAEELFLASHKEAATANHATNTWNLQPGDWPQFLGPERDGVLSGISLVTQWKQQPPRQLWRQRVGPGWSDVIVVDGHLVTQEQRDESEAVVCYDAAAGREVWTHLDSVRFFEALTGAGPRGTPTFHHGRIYAVGGKGKLICLNAADGKLLWSRDLATEAKAEIPQWGFSVSPLVIDDLVLTFAGGELGLVACRPDTGETVWYRKGGSQTYSSPQLVTLHGQRQILMYDNRSLTAVSPIDGTLLWERPTGNEMAVPMLQSLVVSSNELLIATEPNMTLLGVEHHDGKWSTVDRWTSKSLKPSFNAFAVHKGHVYGLDDGILCCLDLTSGKRLWKRGRYGHGQVSLLPDQDLLLILSEQGEVALVAAIPDRYEELDRFAAITGKTWNFPVIAHGRMFVRNSEELACFELPASESSATATPQTASSPNQVR